MSARRVVAATLCVLAVTGCGVEAPTGRQSTNDRLRAYCVLRDPLTKEPPPKDHDIRCTDWNNITTPGSVCGLDHSVKLKDGYATFPSDRLPRYGALSIYVDLEDVFGQPLVEYGDVDGDGSLEAAVSTWCSTPGGTASGQIAQEWVVYTGADPVRPIGSVTAQQPSQSESGLQTLTSIGPLILARGQILALETWYGKHDHDGNPTGESLTVWRYVDGRLVPGEPRIIATPEP